MLNKNILKGLDATLFSFFYVFLIYLFLFQIHTFVGPVYSQGFFKHLVIRDGYTKELSHSMAVFKGSLYASEQDFLFKYRDGYLTNGSTKLWPAVTGRINCLSSDLIDASGFLWIAHSKGLVAYDGKKGVELKEAPGFKGKKALLLSASDSRIAVLTDRALLLGKQYNRKIVFENLNFPKRFFNSSAFYSILYDGSNVWCATKSGVYCRAITTSKNWIRYSTNHGLPATSIKSIVMDSQKRIWACGYDIFGGGVALFSQGFWLRPFKMMENRPRRPESLSSFNNILWITSEKGLTKFDGLGLSNYSRSEGLTGKSIKGLLTCKDFVAARFSDKTVSIINILDFASIGPGGEDNE